MNAPDTVHGGEVFQYVRDLVALSPRRTGSDGGRAAAEYVAASFRSSGIPDVQIDKVPSVRWAVQAHSLHVGGVEVDGFPVAHSGTADGALGPFGTGPDGITCRVIDLDQVGEGDLRDAIVLFDVRFRSVDVAADVFGGEIPAGFLEGTKFGEVYAGLPDGKFTDPYNTTLQERVAAVAQAGAAGFVAVLADYFDSNRYMNENYGGLTIPGVWVTRRQGEEIRRRLAEGARAEATLVLHGALEQVTGMSPIAVLPGQSPETILVHSHHDSAFDGAVQDASGTAVVLALAKHFASIPAERRTRTLMFATMDTHFAGYQSHRAFVASNIVTRRNGREILVDVSIEHVARAARIEDDELIVLDAPSPRLVLTNAGPAVTKVVEDAVEDLPCIAVLPTSVLPTDELPTDADFSYRAGVTVISLISAPIFLYDQCDTLDKVDQEQLAPVTAAFARIVEDLAAATREALCERSAA